MKLTVDLPDALFRLAETFADERGMSRSKLYTKALEMYLNTQCYKGVTDALNQLYSEESSSFDPAFMAAQRNILKKEDW
ncbi:MAG: ChpI protein [Chloroflexi bacterium AL-W]|nr:ChpI protein [Chloroflexi bacterium AL-W]